MPIFKNREQEGKTSSVWGLVPGRSGGGGGDIGKGIGMWI
jgi:hypothetical protein